MKLNWNEIISLLIWLYGIVKEIIKANSFNIPNTQKHDYVKTKIMPCIKKKGWDFNGDDVDKIINGLVWFIKKIIRSKKKQ